MQLQLQPHIKPTHPYSAHPVAPVAPAGVFAQLTNAYAVIALGGAENFYSVFESELADHIPGTATVLTVITTLYHCYHHLAFTVNITLHLETVACCSVFCLAHDYQPCIQHKSDSSSMMLSVLHLPWDRWQEWESTSPWWSPAKMQGRRCPKHCAPWQRSCGPPPHDWWWLLAWVLCAS